MSSIDAARTLAGIDQLELADQDLAGVDPRGPLDDPPRTSSAPVVDVLHGDEPRRLTRIGPAPRA